jgi:hypothetical protein
MRTGRFGAGFLVGGLVAVMIGSLLGGEDVATPTTTTTTTFAPTPSVEPWFEAGEVLIGATALLPRSLNVEGDMAYFDYDLASLDPTLVDGENLQGLAAALPEHWVLTTASGATVTGVTGPRDTSVRFELPLGEAEVASIVLTGWRVAVPFGDRIELPIEKGASASTRHGTVSIETVLEQSISTIVQYDFDLGEDPWDVYVNLVPADPRWRRSGEQLIWEGDSAPASVVLEDAGFVMRPVDDELVVFTAEVAE